MGGTRTASSGCRAAAEGNINVHASHLESFISKEQNRRARSEWRSSRTRFASSTGRGSHAFRARRARRAVASETPSSWATPTGTNPRTARFPSPRSGATRGSHTGRRRGVRVRPPAESDDGRVSSKNDSIAPLYRLEDFDVTGVRMVGTAEPRRPTARGARTWTRVQRKESDQARAPVRSLRPPRDIAPKTRA